MTMRATLVILLAIIAVGVSFLAWSEYDRRATAQRVAQAQEREERYQEGLKGCQDRSLSEQLRLYQCEQMQVATDEEMDLLFGNPLGTATRKRKEQEKAAQQRIEAQAKALRERGQTEDQRRISDDLKEAY